MSLRHARAAARANELIEQRRRFVQATVVRAQCPTSVRPGDSAVVLPDGSIEGFVGGQCAEGSVRTAALGVLASGEPLLLRILPEDGESFPESEGAVTVVNPCLSGGAIEVYLEPKLPRLESVSSARHRSPMPSSSSPRHSDSTSRSRPMAPVTRTERRPC